MGLSFCGLEFFLLNFWKFCQKKSLSYGKVAGNGRYTRLKKTAIFKRYPLHQHGASHPYGLVNNYLNMKGGGGGGGGGGKSQNINLVCNKLQQQTLNDPASDNFDLESDLVSS